MFKVEESEEERNLRTLYDLLKQATESAKYASKELRDVFIEIPKILEQSKRVEKARSEIHSNHFKRNDLKSFLNKFAFELSKVIAEAQKIIGLNVYLDVRGNVVDFLIKEDLWSEQQEFPTKLDFLFESYPEIQDSFGLEKPRDHQELIVILIAGLKMFNSVAPKL